MPAIKWNKATKWKKSDKIPKISYSLRISIIFMVLISVVIVAMSVMFSSLLYRTIRNMRKDELKSACESLEDFVCMKSDDYEIPYYITFMVYETGTRRIIHTNDPFLPLLPDSKGQVKKHFEKDYFTDGNLDILYYAANTNAELFDIENSAFYDSNITCVVAMDMEKDASNKIKDAMPLTFTIIAIPTFIISFIIATLLAKYTMLPVVKITKAAKSISISNFEPMLPIRGKDDELDELSATFNALFKQLKTELDREKMFSSDVSHELKTPLAVILGQTNLLLRWGKDDPAQLEKSLNSIKTETKTMQAIIDNLLEITRIESGKIKPVFEQTSIAELFYQTREEVLQIAPKAKVKIEFFNDLDDIMLLTDPELLHQVLTIIVSNSIKFAGKNCVLTFTSGIEKGNVYITLADDGPGFDEETINMVFERFFRGDASHTRSVGGFGLGLSIAKVLTKVLNGEIFAANRIDEKSGKKNGALMKIIFYK